MFEKIYLVLTGEDETERPRSRKLLHFLKKDVHEGTPHKIIVSGLSSFNLHPFSSDSSRMARYLLSRVVNKENIILEEKSMDTLGNMIFSHRKLEQLLKKEGGDKEVILITEGFHMNRSKKLFQRIFKDLGRKYNLRFTFIKANTFNISSYYWKRMFKVVIEKIKRGISTKTDIEDFLNKALKVRKRYMFDFFILDMILTDADIFRLKNYNDFKNYLFSLPIYNKKYVAFKKYDMKFSIYAKAIEKLIRKKI